MTFPHVHDHEIEYLNPRRPCAATYICYCGDRTNSPEVALARIRRSRIEWHLFWAVMTATAMWLIWSFVL